MLFRSLFFLFTSFGETTILLIGGVVATVFNEAGTGLDLPAGAEGLCADAKQEIVIDKKKIIVFKGILTNSGWQRC